jgi:DNA-binding transcriptional LysR family regulator
VRLFLALYRERTLAEAGTNVGLDASTLSRRLVALEQALGARLFDRTRDGLLPTEAAEVLLPAAEEMAAAHNRFSRNASAFERQTEGTVRLSVPPGLAEAFVAPALVRLRARYPRIQIELDATVRFVDLTRREADLAIRTRRPQAGDLVSVKIGERRWVPMLARDLARKRRPLADWGDLPWIGWGEDLAGFPPAQWLARHVPAGAVVLRTSQVTTQMAAVQAGLGAALFPPAYARVANLRPVRAAPALAHSLNALPSNETWLVGHRALRDVPRIAAVWSVLAAAFAAYEREPAGAGSTVLLSG